MLCRGNGGGVHRQLQVPQDLPDNAALRNHRDDAQRALLTHRAAFHVHGKDALKQTCPTPVRRGGAVDLFVNGKMDALAGLRPLLDEDAEKLTDVRVLDGRYTTMQQAVGTKLDNINAAVFLAEFVAEAIKIGFVGELIERHGAIGRLLVASD